MDGRPLTYRLQRPLLWMVLSCVVAGLCAVAFAQGWSHTPDRPWFAIAFVLSIGFGLLLAWVWGRRWRTITVTSAPPQLRVRGLFRSRQFDLAGAELDLTHFTVTGRAMILAASVPVMLPTKGSRSALTIRTPQQSLVIHGRSGQAERLTALAHRLQQELDLELTTTRETRRRISFARYRDRGGRHTVELNPDMGAHSRYPVIGLVVLVTLGSLMLLFAPVALQQPSYVDAVAPSPEPVIEEWVDYLSAQDIDRGTDTAPVEVESHWRTCDRSARWLWGDSGEVARLRMDVRLPLTAEQERGVTDRLDDLLQRQDWEASTNWREPDLRRIVELEDGHLVTTMSHACLPPDQQEYAEEELSELLATWLLWLADAPAD